MIVVLLVSTQTGLTPAKVQQLRDDVSRIYGEANVSIQWEERAVLNSVTVTLVRSLPPMPGCESAFGCSILDSTATTPPVAFIASQAIWDYERPRPLLRGRLLAYTVAHELGHLIGLPHDAARGIMYRTTAWLPHARWSQAEKLAMAAILKPANAPATADLSMPAIALKTDVTRAETLSEAVPDSRFDDSPINHRLPPRRVDECPY